MPLTYHNQHRSTRKVDHVLVPPAGRVEAIVVGPPIGLHATLSTRCVDTGTDGDPNPAMVIADLFPAHSNSRTQKVQKTSRAAIYKEVSTQDIEKLEANKPNFTVIFTEDKNGFYINSQKFAMDDQLMQFGRKSEKLQRQIEQLELRLEDLQLAQAAVEVQRTESRSAESAAPAAKGKRARSPLPEHLPRQTQTHEPKHSACPDPVE